MQSGKGGGGGGGDENIAQIGGKLHMQFILKIFATCLCVVTIRYYYYVLYCLICPNLYFSHNFFYF